MSRRFARPLAPFLCLALMVTMVPSAHACWGVALRWDKCFGEGTGAANKNFACDTNAGTEVLVASFDPGNGTDVNGYLPNVSGLEAVIDLVSASSGLPAWWQMQVGGCRVRPTGQFTTADPTNVACLEWGGGNANGAVAAYGLGPWGPNTARIKLATAVPPSALVSLSQKTEYWAFDLKISHLKTVGTGACTGCTTAMCIVLSRLNIVTNTSLTRACWGPLDHAESNFVTWQGGGAFSTSLGTGCPAATPALQRTWGQVKSLYR